jgi:3',5'-nucleoside bisphosphate phosphatase
LIDLHTHTTASDGRCTPEDLVARAAAAGVTVLAVTDHDTVSGCAAAGAACAANGIAFVPGIEVTAMRAGGDVHVLGYFLDTGSPALHAFLAAERGHRIDRVRQIVGRLASLGIALDADAILQPAIDDPAKSAGRPWIARALVAAGHARSSDEAFERWLVRGKPAYIAREGPGPEDVFARIHEAGGVASLAHPGLGRRDGLIGGFVSHGLDAVEAYHSEHDAAATARYVALAADLDIAVSGGSDFHGDPTHGPAQPGSVALPREEYERLLRRAQQLRGSRLRA